MENSTDKYLHKKFKKQLSVEPQKIQNNNDKEAKTVLPPHSSVADSSQDNNKNAFANIRTNNQQQTEQCYKVERTRTDNNQSVPNESTNQNCLSVRNSYYACSYVESSISNLNEIGNQVTTNPTPTNTCISYVISNPKPSRVVSLNQSDPPFRPVNFDTNFNQNEPISNSSSVVESSSILDNTYTKQTYVTSKLVKVDKEDISSTNHTDTKDHLEEHTLERVTERKQETHENPPAPDKNSGGKYVCTYCNLACSKPSVLQKHIRAHTNERPYPCVSCGFSFKTRSNLYKHCRSRTHANRVMGNKAQEINNEMEIDSQNRPEYSDSNQNEQRQESDLSFKEQDNKSVQDIKSKPYKPRFHTAKVFFDSFTKENIKDENPTESPLVAKHSNSDLLSLHINELINKNNSIVNSNDPYLIKKRYTDSNLADNINNNERYKDTPYSSNTMNSDEPLNLTNKNRKRCLSEVSEPSTQKSLIKELLLKNLYADSNMQCRYCKMIFQTVTEFELHKLRSCRGANKSGMRYSRSSSVNVASILTQNKNAFDSIPHMQNTVFTLKSPGPFLGKTRLVESDKNKSFSFDDVLPTTFSSMSSPSDPPKTSQRYSLSPLTLQSDKDKRTPVKLFGGEVKITHTSGETKSFKIDNKECDKYGNDSNYVEYGGKLSENRVVKSSLQSGGTVLTNKPNYSKHDSFSQSQDIIHVYDTPSSPNVDAVNIEKSKFSFDRHEILEHQRSANEISRPHTSSYSNTFKNGLSYKYTNIVDFSQKAAKLLAPNLKQLNLTVPGVSLSSKQLPLPQSPLTIDSKQEQVIARDLETARNIDFAQKQISMQQKMTSESPLQQNLYNPMNLIVNGKVVRYVPGIPGPITAEAPLDMAYSSNIISMGRLPSSPLCQQTSHSPVQKPLVIVENMASPSNPQHTLVQTNQENKMFLQSEKTVTKTEELEIKTVITTSSKISELKSPYHLATDSKSPNEVKSPVSEARKFARPNSLALKPSMAAIKQHHGLTPTMFNQILISPDTPRVAKKYMQHFLHGNYFSYLGLKSSTKPVYCTLNKTQPFYVLMKHFKKLSMYSEWRQQDNKTDKLYGSGYDSRQKQQKYTTAGKTTADLIVHSSYKFTVCETKTRNEEQKSSSVLGGYECNEDYTYIRGRGRGRYVCDQCGIRCKKPSMLKKHIRTHSNDRPYTCSHCNFSFKTKGNLTKHMKSKSHTKNYAASSSGSTSSNQQSGTQSSESDTEDSGMDSSDESTTRQQEHEAAYGLLSLSQKTTSTVTSNSQSEYQTNATCSTEVSVSFMNTEQIVHFTKTNFAKNKILDQQTNINFSGPKNISEIRIPEESDSKEMQNLALFLGKTNMNRPLTYPYTVIVANESNTKVVDSSDGAAKFNVAPKVPSENTNEPKSIKQFNVIMRYNNPEALSPKSDLKNVPSTSYDQMVDKYKPNQDVLLLQQHPKYIPPPIVKVNDRVVFNENSENVVTDLRKRKISVIENNVKVKVQKNDEVIDLSMPTINEKSVTLDKLNGINEDSVQRINYNNNIHDPLVKKNLNEIVNTFKKNYDHLAVVENFKGAFINEENYMKQNSAFKSNDVVLHLKPLQPDENSRVNVNYVIQEQPPVIEKSFKSGEYDNSAMETLADIATKQVKLEKNTLAKSVASEYLKLATKNEYVTNEGSVESNSFVSTSKEVNELILKPEENKSCTICAKNFNKPSQLRLHMNVHYLERPFRCDSCAVSFRTKGHLQKHERSASHHNKLSTSPALSSSEPRPFKCSDCNIAFRIHGHLAKHLRSKMHIMKLECLAKIPFGLYAELERSNSLLTEINTADGDQCLESLKTLAKKVFINDPSKLNQIEEDS